ncbi:MAG: 2-oxoglutarate ferredoxin oxidoreductase, alpha subunit [Chlorobi bacterium OLB6]|nr:MAG: 2-oxoglutarate ferredoxin oxidoreductase, alpha subunit [Chlorobi bacterium OLB6]
MNTGQLLQLLRAQFLVPAIGMNKIQGVPFSVTELKEEFIKVLHA